MAETAASARYEAHGVTEWFKTQADGSVEQGFNLATRPSGSGTLQVVIPVSGLVARKGPGGSVVFAEAGRTVLAYRSVTVVDVAGKTVPAYLEAATRSARIVINDRAAVYPLTIDPVWTQQAEMAPSDGAGGDFFGSSVAISGTTAVVGSQYHTVGSHLHQGAAYVFTESGGTWSQQAELTASDGATSDHFGTVAISGTTMIVGALDHEVGSNLEQGAAYVFTESGGTWSQQAELTASDGASGDLFGEFVAVSGSTALIGSAPHQVGSNSEQGAAYVFTESGGTWTQQAELTASDGAASDHFGDSVSVSGTTALVGAPNHEVGSNLLQGAAYVFTESGGTWTQQAELSSSDGAADDAFGGTVAISGTTAVIGAENHEVGANSDQGAAYVFVQSGSSWNQQAELTASDGAASDNFGAGVSIAGTTAVISAPFHQVGSHAWQGAAYTYVQAGSLWSQQSKLTASDGNAYDGFGTVATSGTAALIGVEDHLVGTSVDEGVAYIFSGPPQIQPPTTPLTKLGTSGPGSASTPNMCKACQGKYPIDTSTGAQFETRTDLAVPGRGIPLSLTETYSTATAATAGPLGFGWSWSYGVNLTNGDGTPLSSSPTSVAFNEETDDQQIFTLSGSAWTGPSEVDATLTHNGDGTWTVLRRATESLKFDSNGRLIDETDLNGETTAITYPLSTSVVVTDAGGRTLTATVDTTASPPRITQVADSSSPARTVQFQYDSSDNLTHIIDVNGGDTAYGYDSSHRLVLMRKPRYSSDGALPSPVANCSATGPAHVIATHYDSNGRVDCQYDQLGRETAYAWTADAGATFANAVTVTDPAGNVTVYTYANGELVAETQGSGTSDAATWNYRYDPDTLGLTWTEDPNGNVSTATYDSHGNRLTATDLLSRTTTWTYNSYNEITSVTPPNTYGGSTVSTTYTYDESTYSSGGAGNLTTVSTPLTNASGTSLGTDTIHYSHATSAHPGDITSMVDADGNTWTYTHDSTTGYVTQTTAPSVSDQGGGSVQDSLDACYDTNTGFVTKTVSARGVAAGETCTTSSPSYTTSYTRDPDGKLTSTTDPLGHVTRATFDADRNKASSTDANGQVTNYTYDAADELTVTTRPDTTTLKNDWNGDGTLEDQVDGNGKTTSYGYDHLGRQTSVTDPLSQTTNYVLDGDGNVIEKIDPGGSCTGTVSKCTTHTYDAANELLSTSYSDSSSQNVTIPAYPTGYDANGHRLEMTDATGTSTWTWDSMGNMLSYTNGASKTVAYGYDDKGQETSITYPGQTTPVSRGFDAMGRLDSVEDWNSKTTTYAYDADSDLTSQAVPSSTTFTDTYSFDNADRMYSIADGTSTTPAAGFTYQRDPAGQILSVSGFGTGRGEASRNYSYNSLEQLTGNARASVLSASTENSAVVKADGSVWTWGDNTDLQLGNGSGPPPSPATTSDPAQVSASSMTNVTAVASGQSIQYSAALDASGFVWSWGNNSVGELGNGNTTNQNAPVQVKLNIPTMTHPALSGVVAVAAGGQHTLALRSDGTVWSWGDNAHGQLGIGSTTPSHESYAVQVEGVSGTGNLSGVISIAATKNGSAAVLANGTVVAWGTDTSDQLGPAGTGDSSYPIDVTGITGTPIAVAGGTDQMMVLTSDGHVWAWGGNANGQQGQGTTSSMSDAPTKVEGVGGSGYLSGITSIAAGGGFDMALSSSGNIYEWGSGGNGQLGVGSTATHTTPVEVEGVGGSGHLGSIVGIAGGLSHAVAVDSGGDVYAWGLNTQGELGDHTTTQRTTPVSVYTGTGIGTLTAGTPYAYDTADNLVAQPSGATQSFDAANEVCASIPSGTSWSTPCSGTVPTGVTTYSYDSKGNRTSSALGSSTTSYAYDQANRLCAYIPSGSSWSTPCSGAAPSGVSTYAYDGDDLRQSKTTPSGTTNFSWDESGSLPLLLIEGSTNYIYGPGGVPVEQINGSNTLYYHHDQLGSTRFLTDSSGSVAGSGSDRYSYDAYGNNTTSGTPTTTPTLGFGGEYTDAESGLIYLRARYYDPSTAQFLSRDPAVTITRAAHGYAASALNGTDPSGLMVTLTDLATQYRSWANQASSQGDTGGADKYNRLADAACYAAVLDNSMSALEVHDLVLQKYGISFVLYTNGDWGVGTYLLPPPPPDPKPPAYVTTFAGGGDILGVASTVAAGLCAFTEGTGCVAAYVLGGASVVSSLLGNRKGDAVCGGVAGAAGVAGAVAEQAAPYLAATGGICIASEYKS